MRNQTDTLPPPAESQQFERPRHATAGRPDTEADLRPELVRWLQSPPTDVPGWCGPVAKHLSTRLIWDRDERRQAARILRWYPVTPAPAAPSQSHGSAGRAVTGTSAAMTRLILSLFPGVGLLDSAFEAEGLCVVRGPDLLWGGDVPQVPPAGRLLVGRDGRAAVSRFLHVATV